MADSRFRTMFYVAVGVALLASYGAYRAVHSITGDRTPSRQIVVATSEIPEGVSIEPSALAVRDWPENSLPDSFFTSVDSVAGRVTRVSVFPGDPIVPARLAPVGSGPGLEVKIMPGKRAMAVRTNDVAAISGLVQPNSRVDVLVTFRAERGDEQVAKLFMENMRVLSVGTKVQRGDDGKPINATTAALEVTPEEAERLAVAMNQGSIQLVLRGYGDPDSVTTKGASSADVLSQLRAAPTFSAAPAPAPRRRAPEPRPLPKAQVDTVVLRPKFDTSTVKVYRGSQVSQEKFEKADSTRKPATP
jgi:pilus assembly protein CpaB